MLDAAERAGFDLLLTCDQEIVGASRTDGVVTSSFLESLADAARVAARIATVVDFVQTAQIVRGRDDAVVKAATDEPPQRI